MTSTFPPASTPGPDDVPAERATDQQPDPFGAPADEHGRESDDDTASEEIAHKEDPRAE